MGRLDVENAIVEEDHILDEGNFEMQAGLGDEPAAGDRLAESQHQRLLGLGDGEQRAARRDQREKGEDNAEKSQRTFHLRPPCVEEKPGRGR